MTKAVLTDITGVDIEVDTIRYPNAMRNRITLLDMNKQVGLTSPAMMILPGRDIKIEIRPEFDKKSDIAAVRFNWNTSSGINVMSVMVYATPESAYAAYAEKETYSDTALIHGGTSLTPIIRLTVTHDPGPARMEVFNGTVFGETTSGRGYDSGSLIRPILNIAKKLIDGQGINLDHELKETATYLSLLQIPADQLEAHLKKSVALQHTITVPKPFKPR